MTSGYQISRTGTRCKVAVGNALTAILIPELKAALWRELQKDTQELVIDMMNTTMLDSSGIGLLIASGNTLGQKKATLRVINVSPDLLKLLHSMRLVSRLNASVRTTAG